MHRDGVDVQVLSAVYNGSGISDWHKDTLQLESEKRVHYFNTGYPSILQTVPKTFLQKVQYHLTLAYIKVRIKGNYYDRSALCAKGLLAEVNRYVSLGYMDIIITVGPFFYADHLLSIRKAWPDIRLFLDVRDPWTNNKTAFGYNTLTSERFRIEKEAEKRVAEGYDKIITVADDMGDYFVKEYGIDPDKVVTIRNGFDTLDFKDKFSEGNNRKILLFTGNLYQMAENSFRVFVDELKRMKRDNPRFFEHYECHFYGEIHPSFTAYFSAEINLFFYGKIRLDETFVKISESAACLLFLTDDLNFSFSTKFYEYLSQRKPILVYSLPGKTGEFVEENNLGMQANGNNLSEIVQMIEKGLFYKQQFDISEFEVGNLTKKLLAAINMNN